jgi:hypothetical protein
MTLMSLGPENVRRVPDRGPPDDDIQAASPVEQRMLDSWQRQIATARSIVSFSPKGTGSSLTTLPDMSPHLAG